ncbi:hypothetical protein ACTHGU_17040 [Chitinophagaceae bacterium MMS25-I14]
MMKNFFRKKINNNNWLFQGSYIDVKGLFLYSFEELPNVSYITGIDTGKAYEYIRRTQDGQIVNTYQHSEFNHEEGKLLFNVTFVVLADRKIVEIGGDYVSVLHTKDGYNWAANLLKDLSRFKRSAEPSGKIGFSTQTMN